MKKILISMLCICFVLVAAACGQKEDYSAMYVYENKDQQIKTVFKDNICIQALYKGKNDEIAVEKINDGIDELVELIDTIYNYKEDDLNRKKDFCIRGILYGLETQMNEGSVITKNGKPFDFGYKNFEKTYRNGQNYFYLKTNDKGKLQSIKFYTKLDKLEDLVNDQLHDKTNFDIQEYEEMIKSLNLEGFTIKAEDNFVEITVDFEKFGQETGYDTLQDLIPGWIFAELFEDYKKGELILIK